MQKQKHAKAETLQRKHKTFNKQTLLHACRCINKIMLKCRSKHSFSSRGSNSKGLQLAVVEHEWMIIPNIEHESMIIQNIVLDHTSMSTEVLPGSYLPAAPTHIYPGLSSSSSTNRDSTPSIAGDDTISAGCIPNSTAYAIPSYSRYNPVDSYPALHM